MIVAALVWSCNAPEKESNGDLDNTDAGEHMERAADHTEAAAEEAGDDWRRESQEFRTEAQSRIDRNDAEIERLRAKANLKKAEAKAEYEEDIAELKAKNDRLRTRVGDYKDDSNDGWRKFREEFDRDMNELGNALENLGKDNKK